jgi:hypothetical protein
METTVTRGSDGNTGSKTLAMAEQLEMEGVLHDRCGAAAARAHDRGR